MPKLLLGYFKTYLLWCIGLIALIVAQGCVQLFGLTQEMKRIVDQGIQTGDMNYIIHSGIRMLVFTALVAVCGTGIAWLGARISCGIRKDLMRDCYKKILAFAPQDEEARISHVVFETGLPAVIPYDTVKVEGGRYGNVYETLGAKTLSETIEEDPEHFEEWITAYGNQAERIRKGWKMLLEQSFPDRTPQEIRRIEEQIRLLSRLKVACAPAVAKGISEELMRSSVNDVKENLIPRIGELIGCVDW